MRYYFTSNIEKEKGEVQIQIPFNIWEVCKQREEISADIVVDNQIIDCTLIPLEKGRYKIVIPAGTELKVDYDSAHKLLLHIKYGLKQ